MCSTIQAVLTARLQLRYLQQQQMQSLNQAYSYQAEMVLSSLSTQELLWSVENLRLNNGRSLRKKEPNLDTNRCIKITLGNLLQRGVNWEEMVKKGGELTYKCSGINSSKVCDSKIHKRTTKYSNSLADRQQYCTFISFENGGYTQQKTLAPQQVHLELLSQQKKCNVWRVPFQCSKCTCRLGIAKCQGQFRMENRCFIFPRDCNTHGSTLWICLHPESATNFLNTLHGNQTQAVWQ